MADWLLLLIVFGSLLIVNLLSLLFIYLYKRDEIPTDKGGKAFFIIWMSLFGVTYWIAFGVWKLIEVIRK